MHLVAHPVGGIDVYAVMMEDRHGIDETISATGHTIDEALEALYQRVNVRHYRQQALQERAS